ncbi:MAG: class I SAM-dependent methyltransferase [Candidatus Pacebacteria bacterium]|nr:class I SAM-dependent methyltransferase [Candidatus Paceibacterota bacterium]
MKNQWKKSKNRQENATKPTRGRGSGQEFWNKEYKGAGKRSPQQKAHLALSNTPSGDLVKFTRWLEREYGRLYLNPLASAVDLGCGNGRNLIYLSENFGLRGIGFDISREAILQAKSLSGGPGSKQRLPLEYHVDSIAHSPTDPFPVEDGSQTFVLDMTASHFLKREERKALRAEISRMLKPGGWLFFKTFLLDEDLNAERLLRDHPAEESGSYIHPQIGVSEHVFTEKEIIQDFEESGQFTIHKITKSHRHLENGRAGKRRSLSVYVQKML